MIDAGGLGEVCLKSALHPKRIYELRAKKGRVNYRLLYFFHGKSVALLAHALTKEDVAPDSDIKRAVERKKRYERNPEKHTHEESLDEQA